MPKYLIEEVSMFRMRYVVDAEEASHAADHVVMEEADEFSQKHLGNTIFNIREVTDEEVVKLYFEDHEYMRNWGPEKALQYVSKISY